MKKKIPENALKSVVYGLDSPEFYRGKFHEGFLTGNTTTNTILAQDLMSNSINSTTVERVIVSTYGRYSYIN